MLDEWLTSAPILSCDSAALAQAYRRSLIDLEALRFVGNPRGELVPAAGLPWLMNLFGRDSIVTCLQASAGRPSVAVRAGYAAASAPRPPTWVRVSVLPETAAGASRYR
ncbi:hypothetical protein [Solwaraspora sp. WMMA2101]|uniref:hypothetical protein n=1 Tax=Solwaraspora sp. WMMA2101 TaxID=3404124 RepID=UPI003B957A28